MQPSLSRAAGRLEQALPAAARGEAWGLRVVYDELAPVVHRYLRRRGSSEPEDLTSEVFLTVLPRLSTVHGGAAGLRTFVFSVAHARLVDELRRRDRRPRMVPVDEADVSPAGSAEDEVLRSQGGERVRALLARLPDDQRDVLLLRLLGELTVEQTAAVIGRSAGAVKQLQRRGLVELRRQMQAGVVTL